MTEQESRSSQSQSNGLLRYITDISYHLLLSLISISNPYYFYPLSIFYSNYCKDKKNFPKCLQLPEYYRDGTSIELHRGKK